MSQPLAGKVIIITGAGSGIGLATAHALAQAGAFLSLCDINPNSLTALLPTLPSSCQHITLPLDVRSPTTCNTAVASTVSHFGHLDGLFNCAGINPTNLSLTSTTDEYFNTLVDTNLKGPYNMTRACIPHLKPGSAIVNVSSTAGLRASAGFAIYNATKFGVIGFSKSMALELGPNGVRVNVVAPGPVDTPTNASVVQGVESVRELVKGVSMGRLGMPEEVADVVVFLMGDGARWVNGAVVEVSGGM